MVPTGHHWRLTERLLAKQDGRCYWCLAPCVGAYMGPVVHKGLTPKLKAQFANLDHIVPKAKGGTDLLENVVAACLPCNEAKGEQPPDEWYVKRQEALAANPRYRQLVEAL